MTTAPLVVTCLQLETDVDAAREARIEHALHAIDRAPRSDLIVLPELWFTGYFNFERYASEAESLGGELTSHLKAAAARRHCFIVGGSFVERHEGGLANCTVLINPDGEVILTYRKMHLFGNGSKEAALLTPGADLGVIDTEIGRIGLTTCYDLRFPELYRAAVEAGAELMVVVAAWPAARLAHWQLLVQARAVENQFFVVACNGAGVQHGVRLAGTSLVVDPWGEVLTAAGLHEQMLTVSVDLAKVEGVRQEFPVLKDRRKDFAFPK